MRIATYNVNGVNGRLPVLLRWLNETSPDVVCLQELKAPQEKFPEKAYTRCRLSCDLAWTKKLERCSNPIPCMEYLRKCVVLFPVTRKDSHSRYIEAIVNGIHSWLPLPAKWQPCTRAKI
ncbi:MAG: endonuclease/exonuclease/phosphatase family protein [Chitinophagaceae bacterium]